MHLATQLHGPGGLDAEAGEPCLAARASSGDGRASAQHKSHADAVRRACPQCREGVVEDDRRSGQAQLPGECDSVVVVVLRPVGPAETEDPDRDPCRLAARPNRFRLEARLRQRLAHCLGHAVDGRLRSGDAVDVRRAGAPSPQDRTGLIGDERHRLAGAAVDAEQQPRGVAHRSRRSGRYSRWACAISS